MKRAGILLVSILILSHSWSINTHFTRAQELAAGVEPGDWIKYRVVYNLITSPPEGSSSKDSAVGYVQVEVLSLIDDIITYQVSILSKNGTEISHIYNMSYLYPVEGYFIAANLSAGDILDFVDIHFTINATIIQKCLGVEREVNWVGPLSINGSSGMRDWIVELSLFYQWDRIYGILIESSVNQKNISPEGYTIEVFEQTKIIDTNIWEINIIPQDLDRDSFVGISDVVLCAEAFGSDSSTHLSRWNPYCDIDNDGRVGIDDLLNIAQHFGESY